jgi:hypothetical protein
VAQKPDGKPAQAERVTFTRPAAERIAKVVRSVEAGDRDCGPLTFTRTGVGNPYKLTLATFTGNWQTGEWKTVTLSGSTQTASVYNWCNPAVGGDTSSTTQTRYVIFGRVSGTQSAVEIQMRATQCTATLTLGTVDLSKLPGYEAGVIQLLGHGAQDTASTCSGGLQWYSITTCSTATGS